MVLFIIIVLLLNARSATEMSIFLKGKNWSAIYVFTTAPQLTVEYKVFIYLNTLWFIEIINN